MEYDYFILGQGLSGSLLAIALLKRGKRILVIDDHHRHSSTRVAAGLINPVTGKRLVRTAGLEDCLPVAMNTYGRALVHKPMWRLFHNMAQKQQWLDRQQEPGYLHYLGDVMPADATPYPIKAEYGYGVQLQVAALDTKTFLEKSHDYLLENNCYVQAQPQYQAFSLEGSAMHWREHRAEMIIFCEGYQGINNPWFDYLPYQLAKGEFLTLKTDHDLPDVMINSGHWLLPLGDGLYRLGATYQHDSYNDTTSEAARELLMKAVYGFIDESVQFEKVNQQAGVRPTTLDKQPFIGVHPKYQQIAICNGFGSKGVLMAPWHVKQLVNHLCDGEALPDYADINRYRHRITA